MLETVEEGTQLRSAVHHVTPAAGKRGRPRKPATLVISVRLSTAAYDAYCRCANRSGNDVRAILRHVLTTHAPA